MYEEFCFFEKGRVAIMEGVYRIRVCACLSHPYPTKQRRCDRDPLEYDEACNRLSHLRVAQNKPNFLYFCLSWADQLREGAVISMPPSKDETGKMRNTRGESMGDRRRGRGVSQEIRETRRQVRVTARWEAAFTKPPIPGMLKILPHRRGSRGRMRLGRR